MLRPAIVAVPPRPEPRESRLPAPPPPSIRPRRSSTIHQGVWPEGCAANCADLEEQVPGITPGGRGGMRARSSYRRPRPSLCRAAGAVLVADDVGMELDPAGWADAAPRALR